MLLKQMFCKHEWEREELGLYNLHGNYYSDFYMCNKCGKSHLFNCAMDERIWRRKREFKGDTFIDKGAN
jgi:hypothetical protein